MGKFKPFLFGAILGAGVAVCALQFHVVQSHEGFRVIPRTPQPSLGLAYADVRNWDAETWADRPELVRALVAHGSTDLVASSVAEAVVDSVASENSTLDQLRGFLNENTGGADAGDSLLESSGFMTIPDRVKPSENLDDMFRLEFPDDAKRPSPTNSVSNSPVTSDTTVARRDLPPLTDVFGIDDSGFNPIQKPSLSSDPVVPQPKSETTDSVNSAEEVDLLEGMLFGDDEADGTNNTDDDAGFGVFEEITSSLEARAEETLKRATAGLQGEADRALADSADSMNRFVRDRVEQSIPESVSSMFKEDGALKPFTDRAAENTTLPSAIQAIRSGFDPFIE